MTSTKAVIYVRTSTAVQHLDVQLLDLCRYAEARGLEVVEVFEDQGVSGSRDSRPGLDRLFKTLRQRRASVLLVWRLDRLGRNVKHLLGLIEELEGLNVSLVSFREAIDLGTPLGRLLVTVLGALAEFERDVLRDRVMAGLAAAKTRGVRLGRPKTIDRVVVRALRSQGLSYRQIGQQLGISMGGVQAALKGSV